MMNKFKDTEELEEDENKELFKIGLNIGRVG